MSSRVHLVLLLASSICFTLVSSSRIVTPLVTASDTWQVYDLISQNPDQPSFYLNDHTITLGPGGVWHIFGITHTEPMVGNEVNLDHATGMSLNASQGKFERTTLAMGAATPEVLLWAPHIVLDQGTYHMFVVGGSDDRTQFRLDHTTSSDLWNWSPRVTMFQAGVDGRDPMVLNLGPDFDNMWIIYYCGTNPDITTGTVNHVTYWRTSTSLNPPDWSEAQIAFDGGSDGQNYGGPTESPFVVRRGKNFYLLSGSWDGYTDTRVFLSTNPFSFGSIPLGTATQVGEFTSHHAPEVVRDLDGSWYVTAAGWERGGLNMSRLTWFDGADEEDTSMPIPTCGPPVNNSFMTNFFVPPPPAGNDDSMMVDTPDVDGAPSPFIFAPTPAGLSAYCPLDNAWLMSNNTDLVPGGNFTLAALITLVTRQGNPGGTQWNRDSTAAAIGWYIDSQGPNSPPLEAMFLNAWTDGSDNGGMKLFRWPYEELYTLTAPIVNNVEYQFVMSATVYTEPQISVFYQFQIAHDDITVGEFNYTDTSTTMERTYGAFGLNVWQGAALFQSVWAAPVPEVSTSDKQIALE